MPLPAVVSMMRQSGRPASRPLCLYGIEKGEGKLGEMYQVSYLMSS